MIALLGQQRRERRTDLVRADLWLAGRFIDVNKQPLEVRPVERLVEILRQRLQQPPRIVQQAQQHPDRLASPLHLHVPDFVQPLLDRGQLIAEAAHLGLQPILRPGRISDEIEELVLLLDQSPMLSLQLLPK
ncbi:hypothetical protein AB0A73_29140 [Glycomyces sp. NPDC047369]